MMFHSLTSRVFTPPRDARASRDATAATHLLVSATLLRDVALRALRLKNLRACARESRRPIERAFVSLSRSRSRALAPIRASRHPRARVSSLILHRARNLAPLARPTRRDSIARRARAREKRARAPLAASRPGPR